MTFERFARSRVPGCTIESAGIEWSAQRRRLGSWRVDERTVFVEAAGALVPFTGLHGPDSSTVGRWFANRIDAHRVLAVPRSAEPRWAAFGAGEMPEALRFAVDLGPDVVVRPGELPGRRSGWPRPVSRVSEFGAAWRRAEPKGSGRRAIARPVVVEEFVPGRYLHLVVLDGVVVSAMEVLPARVTGDGRRSVRELAEQENERRSGDPLLRAMPLPVAARAMDALAGTGRDAGYVPGRGEEVPLQSTPREGAGLVDVTGEVDAAAAVAVECVAAVPGLPHAGVDMVVVPGRGPVVTAIRFESPFGPAATMRRAGEVAAAVVDHYVERPEWRVARSTPHTLRPA